MQINVRQPQQTKKFGRGRKKNELSSTRQKRVEQSEVEDIREVAEQEAVAPKVEAPAVEAVETEPQPATSEAPAVVVAEETEEVPEKPKAKRMSLSVKKKEKKPKETVVAELVEEDEELEDMVAGVQRTMSPTFVVLFLVALIAATVIGWFGSGLAVQLLTTLGVLS